MKRSSTSLFYYFLNFGFLLFAFKSLESYFFITAIKSKTFFKKFFFSSRKQKVAEKFKNQRLKAKRLFKILNVGVESKTFFQEIFLSTVEVAKNLKPSHLSKKDVQKF